MSKKKRGWHSNPINLKDLTGGEEKTSKQIQEDIDAFVKRREAEEKEIIS